jgi:type III secretory pathway component EscV
MQELLLLIPVILSTIVRILPMPWCILLRIPCFNLLLSFKFLLIPLYMESCAVLRKKNKSCRICLVLMRQSL